MRADIPEGSATRYPLVEPPREGQRRVGGVVLEKVPFEVQQVAKLVVRNELLRKGDAGPGAVGEVDEVDLAGRLGGIGHLLCISDGRSQRLLAEHMLAVREGIYGVAGVAVVGGDHNDHVDVVALSHARRIIRVFPPAPARRPGRRGAQVDVGHPNHVDARELGPQQRTDVPQRQAVQLRHVARADDAEPDALHQESPF